MGYTNFIKIQATIFFMPYNIKNNKGPQRCNKVKFLGVFVRFKMSQNLIRIIHSSWVKHSPVSSLITAVNSCITTIHTSQSRSYSINLNLFCNFYSTRLVYLWIDDWFHPFTSGIIPKSYTSKISHQRQLQLWQRRQTCTQRGKRLDST